MAIVNPFSNAAIKRGSFFEPAFGFRLRKKSTDRILRCMSNPNTTADSTNTNLADSIRKEMSASKTRKAPALSKPKAKPAEAEDTASAPPEETRLEIVNKTVTIEEMTAEDLAALPTGEPVPFVAPEWLSENPFKPAEEVTATPAGDGRKASSRTSIAAKSALDIFKEQHSKGQMKLAKAWIVKKMTAQGAEGRAAELGIQRLLNLGVIVSVGHGVLSLKDDSVTEVPVLQRQKYTSLLAPGGERLSLGCFQVLHVLADGGRGREEIAQVMNERAGTNGAPSQIYSHISHLLCSVKYITSTDGDGRKKVTYSLTEAGRAVYNMFLPIFNEENGIKNTTDTENNPE